MQCNLNPDPFIITSKICLRSEWSWVKGGLHVYSLSDIMLKLCDIQRSWLTVSGSYATWIKSWRMVFQPPYLCHALHPLSPSLGLWTQCRVCKIVELDCLNHTLDSFSSAISCGLRLWVCTQKLLGRLGPASGLQWRWVINLTSKSPSSRQIYNQEHWHS